MNKMVPSKNVPLCHPVSCRGSWASQQRQLRPSRPWDVLFPTTHLSLPRSPWLPSSRQCRKFDTMYRLLLIQEERTLQSTGKKKTVTEGRWARGCVLARGPLGSPSFPRLFSAASDRPQGHTPCSGTRFISGLRPFLLDRDLQNHTSSWGSVSRVPESHLKGSGGKVEPFIAEDKILKNRWESR